MAENKKSVLLYCDLIHTVEQLDDTDAGLLFKHYLRYINDQNPEPPNKLIQIVFEPIKQTLKRDLRKWEGIKANRSKAGIASAEKRKQTLTNSTSVESVEQTSTNSTVSVSVIDNVSVSVIDNVINTEIYTRPRDFLKQFNEMELEQMHMKSGLNGEFETCLEQWSLKVEESNWKYSAQKNDDYRRLKAGFQKWLNTWVSKEKSSAKKEIRNNKPMPQDYLTIAKIASDGISND